MMTVNLPPKVRPGDPVRAGSFNSLVDAVRAVMPIAGENTRVSYSTAGAKIDVKSSHATASSVRDWWQVKWDDGEACWAVCIASDSVAGGGSFAIVNERIGTTEWHKVDGPTSSTTGVFDIVVHVKRRVKIGSGSIGLCVYVAATSAGQTGPGAETENHRAGDVFEATAARCSVVASTAAGQTTYQRSVERRFRSQVQLGAFAAGTLELYWACPSAAPFIFTPHVEAQTSAPLCGVAMADTALPATGTQTVRYQITCTTSYTPAIVTSGTSSPSVVSIIVYTIANGVVTADTRANIQTQVFYP